MLNSCPTSLNQGRYTWRHACVLYCLFNILSSNALPNTTLYADIPGCRASDTPPATIPLHILYTTARPDIVAIQNDLITFFKLTIPINTKEGLNKAKNRKQAKENYIHLLNNLRSSPTLRSVH